MAKPGACLTVVLMVLEDWDQVSKIYQEGIETRNATFEVEVPSFDSWWKSRMPGYSLVAVESEGQSPGRVVLGWVTLSSTSSRSVYAGVAELSLYVGNKYKGRGVGSALLQELIKLSESQGIWTLQSGIFPENEVSIRLHKRMGFREIGLREKIGFDKVQQKWRDYVLLERRSKVVGIVA